MGWICTGPKSKLDWILFKGYTSSKVLYKCHWRSPVHAETLLNLMISCNSLCQTIVTITTISKNKFWKNLLELGWGWFWVIVWDFLWTNKVIRNVRQTQHQNPEFGHTQGETQKDKNKLAFNGGWGNSENHQFCGKTEFHPVFPFSWAPRPPRLLLHIFSLLLPLQLL